eukprot:scaffold290_cov367-Pinguiococcus_pyrenoidosus.AAC.3
MSRLPRLAITKSLNNDDAVELPAGTHADPPAKARRSSVKSALRIARLASILRNVLKVLRRLHTRQGPPMQRRIGLPLVPERLLDRKKILVPPSLRLLRGSCGFPSQRGVAHFGQLSSACWTSASHVQGALGHVGHFSIAFWTSLSHEHDGLGHVGQASIACFTSASQLQDRAWHGGQSNADPLFKKLDLSPRSP